MNVIPSPISASQPGPVEAGTPGSPFTDDASGLSFEDLLPGRPDGSRDEQEDSTQAQSPADRELADANDATPLALLPFLPAPLVQSPAPVTGHDAPLETDPRSSDAILVTGPSVDARGPNRAAPASPEIIPPNTVHTTGQATGIAANEVDPAAGPAAAVAVKADKASAKPDITDPIITAQNSTPIPKNSTQTDAHEIADTKSPAKISIPTAELKQEGLTEKTQFAQPQGQTAGPSTDGTAVAMQRRIMPELTHETDSKPTKNIGADAFGTNVAVAAGLSPSREESGEPRPHDGPQPASSAISSLDFSSSPRPERHSNVSPAEFHVAAHCVEQTMDLAERIHVRGNDRIEVRMRLLDGQEVTISLHLKDGAWKPVFKTETEALCQALEQAWHQSLAQPSGRSVRFGTPVFESLQSQPDLSGGMHQRPDSRNRSFNEPGQETFSPPAARRNRAVATAPKPARTAASSGVRLYA